MLKMGGLSKFAVVLTTLLLTSTPVKSQQIFQGQNKLVSQPDIAALADGQYQFCSEPDPKDWRVGAGVCFNFAKVGNQVDGYYGYPHSGDFVCINGQAKGNSIRGKGFTVLVSHEEQIQLPQGDSQWDSEGNLTVNQGQITRTINSSRGRTYQVSFSQANLNLHKFYQYNSPRMTPASQLCGQLTANR